MVPDRLPPARWSAGVGPWRGGSPVASATMRCIVIRPRIQVPILVVLCVLWGLLGVTYFTNGDVVAKRDRFGIV